MGSPTSFKQGPVPFLGGAMIVSAVVVSTFIDCERLFATNTVQIAEEDPVENLARNLGVLSIALPSAASR